MCATHDARQPASPRAVCVQRMCMCSGPDMHMHTHAHAHAHAHARAHAHAQCAYPLPAQGPAASVIEVTRAVAQEVLEELGLVRARVRLMVRVRVRVRARARVRVMLEELGLRVGAMFGRQGLVHVRHHREVGPPRLLGLILLLQQLVNDTRRPWVP